MSVKKIILCIFIFFIFNQTISYASDFYVSNTGNDNNSGLSESQPWETLSKVNNYNFKPGDVVHFKSGNIWREQLIPKSGAKGNPITYTSYGTGAKPSFYGSMSKSSPDDWTEESTNIWTLNKKIYNAQANSKAIPQDNLSIWQEQDAQINYDENEKQNGFIRIDNVPSNTVTSNSQAMSNIQLIIRGLNIQANKDYTLSFRAKSTQKFKIPLIDLMIDRVPWTSSYSSHSSLSPTISTDWTNYSIHYKASCSDKNGRITFYLGGALPTSSSLYLSNINFAEVTDPNIYEDVGNIIFNDGESCGIKVFNESELTSQNRFWYDKNNHTLKMYSTKNPATMHRKIECAITRNIINESNKSYVVYKGLDLRYGGAHGIGGDNTHNIKILNCDISYIGGGELTGQTYSPARYGNGIEFWNNAHDNLVDGCNIWQIYDSGVTNQGTGSGIQQYNITYRNNTIKNTEWSYEYWNAGTNTKTYNILFDNNICSNAGYSWSNSQRRDPTGFNLRLYSNIADISNFVVSNNKFENAKQYSIYTYPTGPWKDIEQLQFKSNSYNQSNGTIAPSWFSKIYPLTLN